jgi:transposase, IS30 family
MPYTHFNSIERNALQYMININLDKETIGRILGKSTSSVCREISRNGFEGYYTASTADDAARTRRNDTKPCPKRGNSDLMADIESRFIEDHSPEQIAGRLNREYPDNPEKHVSYETIYSYLYSRLEDKPELRIHFRQGQKKRHKRLSGKDKRGIIPNRKFIDLRPAIVDEKTRFGDWEGDTVEGGGKKGYVTTFVERTTKLLIAYPLRNKTTESLVQKARKPFSRLPRGSVHTCTVDNGKEFAAHEKLAEAIGGEVYFARPYHSWERGLNEHTNGLLRQYLPKRLPLDSLTHQFLDKWVKRINNRPRKSLGYRTPREAFDEQILALQT